LPLTFGRYVLQERLGAGGMGQVFRAYDNELRRDVALKLPLLDSDDPNQIERFRGEARTAATIEHPGVCQIYDIGELDGQQYITMKLVDGKSLSDLMKEGKTFTTRQAVGLVRKIADALTVAHAKGVIHRDIKPANIMLTSKSEPIVVDFGLAHQSSESRSRLTQTGAAVGTPAYMPIEQATGDLKNINQRSDVYSLTAVLFRILAGEPPYQGAPLVIIGQIIAGRIPSLAEFRSDLDEELLRIVAKGMAYKQEDRYASMRELSNDLKEYLRRTADAGTATQTARPPAKPAPPAVQQLAPLANFGTGRRNRKFLLGAACLFPFLFWLGTIIFVRTEHGTLRIEITDPRLEVTVDGEVVTVKDGDKSLQLTTGLKKIQIKSGDLGIEVDENFTLKKEDGEVRLHVVLLDNNNVQLRKGPAPAPVVSPDAGSTLSDSKSQISTPSAGWQGWPSDAPPPAIAPFDSEQAKLHQQAWADYLKIPVERTNSIGMKFVLIPPGQFTMGSTPAEIEAAVRSVREKSASEDEHWRECIKSEGPQHQVILTQAIYLGVNEVTQAEYEKVMGVNPSQFSAMGRRKVAVAGLETSKHPVENVSWYDAAEFCAKLSQQEKLKPFDYRPGETITPLDGTAYQLPSEAEWEFACRAGTATKYWFGDKDEDLVRAGWCGENSGDRTHAVGGLEANPFGLYDIHGNVFEWVQDGWDANYYSQFSEKPAINPNVIFPFSGFSAPVLRGGRYYASASGCRSSLRGSFGPTFRYPGAGFRVSLVAVGSRVSAP
jgi:formylglycine-generating enzyme required for sulfatase activity